VGPDQVIISTLAQPVARPAPQATGKVVSRDVLDGVIHEYERAA
jgi:hypothetical protein